MAVASSRDSAATAAADDEDNDGKVGRASNQCGRFRYGHIGAGCINFQHPV